MIEQTKRHVARSFQLDTNCINARGRLPNVTQLERWRDDGVIDLAMSEIAQDEAQSGCNSQRISKALSHLSWWASCEPELANQIERILFSGGAKTQNERNDVAIVCIAKQTSDILVTSDGASKAQPGGILGNRSALAGLGVSVMTDSEAVSMVRKQIDVRDTSARWKAQKYKLPLPEWVGKD